MNVYVESNFVIELALRREEVEQAHFILEAARVGSVRLVIPIFSVCEPYSTISYRARNRSTIFRRASDQLRDLERSTEHHELAAELGRRVEAVLAIERDERNGLEAAVEQLLSIARTLPLVFDTFSRSLAYQRLYDLDQGDALVLAAVMIDLEEQAADREHLFVTRDRKDFDLPGIEMELREQRCELLTSFRDAAERIHH